MAYTTIDKPTDYFNTKLYTGNGGTQSITGVGFQPDWTWIKNRTDASTSHYLTDSVRGAGKSLRSNSNNAEATETNQLTAFDSDGFSIGNWGDGNGSGKNIVSWNWKASGSTASNTDGSITSTVSANTTAGFSIVSFTGNGSAGATVGHGLSAIPKFILVKVHTSSTAYDWRVFHASLGATKNLILNDTSAVATATNKWNDTEPTSSVFSLGNTAGTNESGSGIIAYCFAEKKGYSKFGSYVANGNASGGFVYTGFKIGWLMIKRTDSAAGWIIYDSKREGRNTENDYLLASSSSAEGGNNEIDLLSNGFKPREANRNELNVSGASYVYMCFAESPFTTSTGIPTTAR